MTTAAPPPVQRVDERRDDLARMKRRATTLLVAMTAVFLLLVAFTDDEGAWGYAWATAEASMVGGLADWFAVTALFRHPLGIPIPHTAVIRERKDQFGETLGAFVQQNFLSPQVLGERLTAARPVERVASWASTRANAETVARHGADLLVGAADLAQDDDVSELLHEQLTRVVEAVPVAPLAGRGLRMMIDDGRHTELLDAGLRNLEAALDEHHDQLRARFADGSPWWIPGAVEDRIFERLLTGVRSVLTEVNADPDHDYRRRLDGWLRDLAERLEHAPELHARGEQIKAELLAHPELQAWSSSLWIEIKSHLRSQAEDPDSELRSRVAGAVQAAGRRLDRDPELAETAQALIERGVRALAERFRPEITELISGTIDRWDGQETSDRLELLLGRDLQFIRINGTVVGGLAGLVIHTIAEVAG